MIDYLPKNATSEQACNWLQAKTGQTWILPRLLECHLTPYFWLDYKPGYPTVFGEKIEGYQTSISFQGDLCRLESDSGDALVNMFAAHDGSLIRAEPGLRVPLSELRFKREHIERVAEIINRTKAAPAQTPAPVVTASDGPLTTTIHSTKTRRDTLTPVIELAQKQCTDSQDTAAVWGALLVLAEKKTAPLIGATEDGLQYLKNGTAANFNRDALRKRLDR